MTAVAIPKLTYEDYLYFPDDGRRHEILDGDHVLTPAPTPRHQFVLLNLLHHLDPFVRERRLGRFLTAPVDVVLTDTDVVQPDLLYLRRENLGRVGEKKIDGAPDLVVEILSEGTRKRDEMTKRHLYERTGVEEYWVVDPELEVVKVYRRDGESGAYRRTAELSRDETPGARLESPLFPGFALSLDDVFA